MGVLGLFGQHPALADAKAVLLVHHGQAQPGKFHALAEDGVGADDQIGLVVPDGGQRGAAGGGFHPAGQQGHPHPKGGEQAVEVLRVLGGQNFRRSQQSGLIPAADTGPDGGGGHQCFTAAHVSLQQAVHGSLARHVG